MAYINMSGYSASVTIPTFEGLMQYGDGVNGDPRYAVEAVNMATPGGVLQPAGAHQLLPPQLDKPIRSLTRLYRRWHVQSDEREVLIAASGGQLYWMLAGGAVWQKLDMPEGFGKSCYDSDEWSSVTYEINPEGSTAPVDVLLMSNAKDGMVCIQGDSMTVTAVPTPKKFGVITRYAERIWGGAIDDDPDMLVYSAPFDPFDWNARTDIPEDGAGDIQQPSWDGDSFTALVPFGSQLLAFKETRVWRILGTDPGEYAFKEQYGGGVTYPATVAVDAERVLMLGDDGVVRYDGVSVEPYYQQYAQGVFRRMNPEPNTACACYWKDAYYLALPLDGAQMNNAVLIYNAIDKTWLLREGVYVEAFLPLDDELYFTSATTPGRMWRWGKDCFTEGTAAAPSLWVGPWLEFNRKDVSKSNFTLYFTAEVARSMVLSVSIETEKKIKTKQIALTPALTGGVRQKRVLFSGTGRRFRILISSEENVPWRLLGGAYISLEVDED